MSSRVDDRSMHELYLWPFADSVKAGVCSVMCSYNKINGQYSLRSLYRRLLGHVHMCTTPYFPYKPLSANTHQGLGHARMITP
jgi:beta-glucosidase-like glycosyl hydrolase